ncbi:hypothetical protein Lser_V15G17330 [Lactuca serriola]
MAEGMSGSPLLEDIPGLLHRIQMRLPVKEAACTSVLSKSWLHAWSTIPTLRFLQATMSLRKEQKPEHLKVIDHTLKKYLHNNIPIERLYLMIDTENQEYSSSLAERWITSVATKSCLKQLSILIMVTSASFSLPDDILSGKNLTKLRVTGSFSKIHSLLMTTHPVINSVSLRKLHLKHVHISEQVIHEIFSTCKLLVDVELFHCKGFDTIKIKNLGFLNNLQIDSYERNRILEINEAPNLSFFWCVGNPLSVNMDSLEKVTHLSFGDVFMDEAFLDMIKLKFPLLESLTLYMRLWNFESFHFTCASLKRLSLLGCSLRLINVQVNAPKLQSFYFEGQTMPSLLFPAVANSGLKKIKLGMYLSNPVDTSFFLKMRNALELSIEREIGITMTNIVILPPFEVDIINLRKMAKFPALDVKRLLFKTIGDEGLWESSPFFDAFFTICHPKKIITKPDKMFQHHNHFCKLMVREVMEKKNTGKAEEYLNWPYYLKGFEVKSEKEKSLPDGLRTSLDGSSRHSVFKLNWR